MSTGGGKSDDSGTTTIKIVSASSLSPLEDEGAVEDSADSVVVTTSEEVVQEDGQQIYIIETTEEEEEVVQDVAVYETVSALEQLSRGGSGEVIQVYEEVVLDDDNTEFVEVEVTDGRPNSPLKVKETSSGGEFNVCRVCHQFVPINEIAEHNAQHHGSLKELTCVDCAKIFKSKRSLFGHRKEKHSGVTEVHICPECGKSFGRKSNLKAHRESLHYGKKFPCSICERIFTNRSSMNQHVKKAHNANTILS